MDAHLWSRVAVVRMECAAATLVALVHPLWPAPAIGKRYPAPRAGKGDPATGDYSEQLHPGDGGSGLTRAEFTSCFIVPKKFDRGDAEPYKDFIGRVSGSEDALIQECVRDCHASGGREVCLNIVGNQFPSQGSQGSRTGSGTGFVPRCVNCKLPVQSLSPLCPHHEPAGTTKLQRCIICRKESRDGTCLAGDSHISIQNWNGTRATCATCHSGTRKVANAVLTTRALQITDVSTAA